MLFCFDVVRFVFSISTLFLLQVVAGSYIKENVDELCWTLTAKKNYQTDKNSSTVLPEKDAFRLWCLFNFLSEDKYPLVMVPDEVGSTNFGFTIKFVFKIEATVFLCCTSSSHYSSWLFLLTVTNISKISYINISVQFGVTSESVVSDLKMVLEF